jgi:hypothetical protein
MILLGWLACAGQDSGQGPTYHQDVAPILVEHCGACHQQGGIAGFSVTDYAQASQWGEAMVKAVDEGRMPPWFASETEECEPRIGFLDDPRLSEDDKDTLRSWVEAGMPEGEPGPSPITVPPPDRLEDPDLELTLPAPFAVSGTADIYQCFRVPLELDGDRWITGVEVEPDNDLVVHHVLVWNDPRDLSADRVGPDGSYPCDGDPGFFPTEIVSIWTPGASPTRAPENAGTLLHPGASLVLNVHYHPTGTTTELDQSKIRLKLTSEQPAQHTTWFLVDEPFGADVLPGPRDQGGPEFRIPAGDGKHRETMSFVVPSYIPFDLDIFAITPHMHYLGREMLVTLRHASGEDECLIHTPGYRFDFQTMYTYDTSQGPWPHAAVGDTIEVRCTYDNSLDNPYMPQHLAASESSEPHDVYWGEETSDEMCMAMIGLVLPPIDWLSVF